MAVTDFSSLKQYVINRVARDDYTDQQATDDVAFAESVINRTLRIDDTLSPVQTLNLVANQRDYVLPNTFLSMATMAYDNGDSIYQVTMAELLGNQSKGAARPTRYAIQGKTVRFDPSPDTAYTLNYVYQSKIPALSNSNTTNWMIDDYPDVYCDAVMYMALKRFRDTMAVTFRELMNNGLQEINSAGQIDILSSGVTMEHNVRDNV